MKVKRFLSLSLVLITVMLLFSGCGAHLTDMVCFPLYTRSYRAYAWFSLWNDKGTSKEKTIEEIGLPDICFDTQGNHYCQRYGCKSGHSYTDTAFKEILLREDVVTWRYECYKLPDPADPYDLVIKFDENGNSTSVEMEVVPGG